MFARHRTLAIATGLCLFFIIASVANAAVAVPTPKGWEITDVIEGDHALSLVNPNIGGALTVDVAPADMTVVEAANTLTHQLPDFGTVASTIFTEGPNVAGFALRYIMGGVVIGTGVVYVKKIGKNFVVFTSFWLPAFTAKGIDDMKVMTKGVRLTN